MKLPDELSRLALSEHCGHALTREDYLRDYALCWQPLLLTGRLRSESRTLSADEACQKLQKRVA